MGFIIHACSNIPCDYQSNTKKFNLFPIKTISFISAELVQINQTVNAHMQNYFYLLEDSGWFLLCTKVDQGVGRALILLPAYYQHVLNANTPASFYM